MNKKESEARATFEANKKHYEANCDSMNIHDLFEFARTQDGLYKTFNAEVDKRLGINKQVAKP